MTAQEFLKEYMTANDSIVIRAVRNTNPLVSARAVFEIVRRGMKDSDTIAALQEESKRNDFFWQPYTVGDIAKAAYHILTGTAYNGERETIKELIKDGMAGTKQKAAN